MCQKNRVEVVKNSHSVTTSRSIIFGLQDPRQSDEVIIWRVTSAPVTLRNSNRPVSEYETQGPQHATHAKTQSYLLFSLFLGFPSLTIKERKPQRREMNNAYIKQAARALLLPRRQSRSYSPMLYAGVLFVKATQRCDCNHFMAVPFRPTNSHRLMRTRCGYKWKQIKSFNRVLHILCLWL